MPGWVGRMSGDAGELTECEVKTLMTTGHTPPSRCAALDRVEPNLVSVPGRH